MARTEQTHRRGDHRAPLRRLGRGVLVRGVLLYALWLLLSGKFDAFHLAAGLFCVGVVLWLDGRLSSAISYGEFAPPGEKLYPRRVLSYIPWLLWEIVVGSLQVAYIVLHPSLPVDPSLLRFRARLPHSFARIILGNSITLTPGTVTIQITGEEFLIHVLTDESASNLVDGTMPGKVARLFRKLPHGVVSEVKSIKSIEAM